MSQQEPLPPGRATERWKRSLGRLLDSHGFTVEEWEQASIAAHRDALLGSVQHILERLRSSATQRELLERDTLDEDWNPWLSEQFGAEVARILHEADPVGIAYGLRWCEIVLDRRLDIAEVVAAPPEPVIQWTRDLR